MGKSGFDARPDRGRRFLVVAAALVVGLSHGCSGGGSGRKKTGGGGGGQADPIQLIVQPGPAHPGSVGILPPAADVVVLQVALQAGAEEVTVRQIEFLSSGTGNEATGIDRARLFRDENGDGLLDGGDTPLCATTRYGTDDSTIGFAGLGVTLPAGSTETWLLVYDIPSGPALGQSFCAGIIDETYLTATSDGAPARIEVRGPVQGCVLIETGTLTVGLGPEHPGAREIGPCDVEVVAMQLDLSASLAEEIILDEIQLTAAGTGNDATEILGVSLHVDENDDGVVDPGDTLLAGPDVYSGDDGFLVFAGLGRVFAPGSAERWLVSYEISTPTTQQQTFRAEIVDPAHVTATGTVSQGRARIVGVPLSGGDLVVSLPRLISARYVDRNGSSTVDNGDRVVFRFNQDVTLIGRPIAKFTFRPVPGGSYGVNATLQPTTRPDELLVSIQVGSTLVPNGIYGVDPDAMGVEVLGSQTVVHNCAGVFVGPNPAPIDIEGGLQPRITVANLVDFNQNCITDQGDHLEVTFTSDVTVLSADPLAAFRTLVTDDTLGAGASYVGGPPSGISRVIIELGAAPVLTAFGVFDPAVTDPDSPSGIDVIAGAGEIVDARHPSLEAATLPTGGADIAAPWFWTAAGDAQAAARFGARVKGAGDVDGDGFDDILVGAPEMDTTQQNAGRAYLYRGGAAGLGPLAAWTSSGQDQAFARFADSLAGAGDVNGDGFADVIVGAPTYSTGETSAGAAYVFLGGGTGLSTTPDWTSNGENAAGANFGFAVSSAGDVNADGYDDVIVGAPGASTTRSGAGKAFVYLGGISGLAAAPIWTSSGDNAAGEWFGSAVARAGDVNGDGHDDILVGAVGHASQMGKVFGFRGASGGVGSNATFRSTGDGQTGARFGGALDSAGDVDGDGYDDVVIGADRFDETVQDEGKVYVHLGAANGLGNSAAWTSTGDGQADARFGWSVAGAGDLDGDGHGDIVVGARTYSGAALDMGRAYVFLGEPGGLPTAPIWTSSGAFREFAWFGAAVASAGDVDGSGLPEVLIGASGEDRAYVFCVGR